MKKAFLLLGLFLFIFVTTGCGTKNIDLSVEEIVDKVYESVDGEFAKMNKTELTNDNLSYYLGVESLDFNSSIAGGGRYDNLIGKFLKEQIPAVGFSIGFERIYSILMEKESYNTEKQKKVVLIYEEDQVADAIRYAEELRKTYKTALYIKPKKLGKFLNKLEEQGFDGFQVFGRDEEVRMFGEQ